jgi:capping protein (actin filament) muscle Z-line, beta
LVECDEAQNVKSGFWNSINLIQVIPNGELKQTVYKLTTTVILELVTISEKAGEVALSGYQTAKVKKISDLTAQKQETRTNENNEIACLTTIGTMIENHESTLRSNLEAVYFGKTQEV